MAAGTKARQTDPPDPDMRKEAADLGSDFVRPSLPPARYVCCLCGVCIATADALEDAAGEALSFRELRVPAGGEKSKEPRTLQCPWCDNPLGRSRGDGVSQIRKDRVVQRPDGLDVCVCGLKEQDIASFKPVLEGAFPECSFTLMVLKKAELRGFQLDTKTRFGPDLVVVVHRNEGRILLTDRNGFYNDVLASAWQQAAGNVAVVLTRSEAGSGALFDEALVKSLAEEGGQPTAGVLGSLGRLLSWGTEPSKQQLAQLAHLATKAYCREPIPDTTGVPPHWMKRPPSKQAAVWCNLL